MQVLAFHCWNKKYVLKNQHEGREIALGSQLQRCPSWSAGSTASGLWWQKHGGRTWPRRAAQFMAAVGSRRDWRRGTRSEIYRKGTPVPPSCQWVLSPSGPFSCELGRGSHPQLKLAPWEPITCLGPPGTTACCWPSPHTSPGTPHNLSWIWPTLNYLCACWLLKTS